jgi:hypothetical protein
MPSPPLSARLVELVHEYLARRMPELITRPAQTSGGAAEAHKIRVAHLAEGGARFLESGRRIESGRYFDLFPVVGGFGFAFAASRAIFDSVSAFCNPISRMPSTADGVSVVGFGPTLVAVNPNFTEICQIPSWIPCFFNRASTTS